MSAGATPKQKISIGRIVLYRAREGHDYAAVITAVENPEDWTPPLAEGHVHLQLIMPPFGVSQYVEREKGVPYSADPKPGTWRWPERA